MRLGRGIRTDAHEPKSFPRPADVPGSGVLEQHPVQRLDARQGVPGRGELRTVFGDQGIAGGHEIVQRQSRSQVQKGAFGRGHPDAVEHHNVPGLQREAVSCHVRPFRDAAAPRPGKVDPPVAVCPQGEANAPDPRRGEVAEHGAFVELAVGPQRCGACALLPAGTRIPRDTVIRSWARVRFRGIPAASAARTEKEPFSKGWREFKSAHSLIMMRSGAACLSYPQLAAPPVLHTSLGQFYRGEISRPCSDRTSARSLTSAAPTAAPARGARQLYVSSHFLRRVTGVAPALV